jgi:hypothetical protein
MSTQLQDWPSPSQVAVRIGITPQRVRQLLDEGRLLGVRTSLGHLIDPASVERLVAERAERGAVVAS